MKCERAPSEHASRPSAMKRGQYHLGPSACHYDHSLFSTSSQKDIMLHGIGFIDKCERALIHLVLMTKVDSDIAILLSVAKYNFVRMLFTAVPAETTHQ